MTNTSRAALRMSAAAALAATALSTAAYAEYRCATPGLLLLGEKKACELAKQPTPEELIRFVHRTQGIYNLYVYDYVNEVDGARWEQAKHHAVPNTAAVAEVKSVIKRTPRLD